MAQIGSILRESRIRMGLSLKEVSEVTKVRVKYLEALEQDDYQAIPGPTFVKAYLRTYASVLRLDADGMVEEYRSTYERRKSSDSEYYDLTLEQMRSRTMRGHKKRPVRNTRRGYTLAGVLAIIAVVLLAYFGSRGGGGGVNLDPNSVGGSTTTLFGVATTTTTLGGSATTTTSEPVYTGGDVVLRIEATGDCYLIVRDTDENGAQSFGGLLRSGEQAKGQGAKRYYVQIGEPDAIKIFINDVPFPSPADGGEYYVTETSIEHVP